METIHVRANPEVLNLLYDKINALSKNGDKIEVIDNESYNKEQQMIYQGLLEEKSSEVFAHENVWEELLR